MHSLNTRNPFTRISLLILPVITAWLFVPQLAYPFEIKHHFSILVGLIMVVSVFSSGGKLTLPRGLLGSSLLLWMLAVLLSTAFADNSYLSSRMLLEVTTFLLVALLLVNLSDVSATQRHLETGILIAGMGVAMFALKQYFFPSVLDPSFSALGKMNIYSTLGNSNLAALIILPALPLTAWRCICGSWRSRAGFMVIALLLFCGLLATQARHALIAIVVMIVVALLWFGSVKLRKNILIALFTLSVVTVALLLLIDLPPSVVHSIKGRGFIWLTTLTMMADHPLAGVGLGHFGLNHLDYQGALFSTGNFDAYVDNAAVISEGHNDFLNWGATTGLLGLIGFTLLCATTLIKGWQSATLKQHAPQFYLALVGYIVAMFFISVTSYTASALFFWLLLGMIWAQSDLDKIVLQPTVWQRNALTILFSILIIYAGNQAWHELRSSWHEAQGDKRMEEHDLWLAEKGYQQALQWNPHHGGLLKKQATVLFLSGNLHEAAAKLAKARKGSGDLGITMLQAEILTRMGDYDRAVAIYRQITASFPNMIGAHFILGQIYQLQGKRELAEVEFHKVLNIKPSPFNLNLTMEKVELQKRIVRDYLHESSAKPAQQVEFPDNAKTRE